MLDIDRVDISARHLREKDERLRLATDAAALGVWSWHPETDRIMLENERLHGIFGLARAGRSIDATRFLMRFVHPADSERLQESIAHTLRTGERLHFEGASGAARRCAGWSSTACATAPSMARPIASSAPPPT